MNTRNQNSLDVERIAVELPHLHVEHYAVLPSTQDRARDAAACPLETTPLLIVADYQTAGRGRESHAWWSGGESLAFSLLFDPARYGCPRRPAPCLSLAVSVAIVQAIGPRLATGAEKHAAGLHWPNDVFVGERKLAGVLVEVLPDGRHIVGVGLNVNDRAIDAPAELRERVGTLRDLTGRLHELTPLLVDLLTRLESRLRELAAESSSLGSRFNELCLQRGRQLTLYIGDRTVTGQCVGIAPDGGLLLDTPSGVEAFYCGTLQPPKKES